MNPTKVISLLGLSSLLLAPGSDETLNVGFPGLRKTARLSGDIWNKLQVMQQSGPDGIPFLHTAWRETGSHDRACSSVCVCVCPEIQQLTAKGPVLFPTEKRKGRRRKRKRTKYLHERRQNLSPSCDIPQSYRKHLKESFTVGHTSKGCDLEIGRASCRERV